MYYLYQALLFKPFTQLSDLVFQQLFSKFVFLTHDILLKEYIAKRFNITTIFSCILGFTVRLEDFPKNKHLIELEVIWDRGERPYCLKKMSHR